jgi:hypothetical protein
MMRARIATSITAGLFVIAAVGAPAAADPGGDPDDCPDGAVCFWTEDHFRGEMSVRDNPGQGCDPAPDGEIGSVVNNLDRPVVIFADDDCWDFVEAVDSGEAEPYVPTRAHAWR